VQAVLTGHAVARFGAPNTLMIGIIAGAIGFALQGLVTTPWLYLAGIPIFAVWGFISPAVMQILSARAGPEAQGQLQGANASLMSIANLAGPLIFSQIFSAAIANGPGSPWAGAPFLLASALLVVAGLIALRVAPPFGVKTFPQN
jgi:MFS transporter, DHA1 family, tetracycline resistance protein